MFDPARQEERHKVPVGLHRVLDHAIDPAAKRLCEHNSTGGARRPPVIPLHQIAFDIDIVAFVAPDPAAGCIADSAVPDVDVGGLVDPDAIPRVVRLRIAYAAPQVCPFAVLFTGFASSLVVDQTATEFAAIGLVTSDSLTVFACFVAGYFQGRSF